ncbi:MAG: ribbon-helix-helix protein, CopG family, partial [Planctomycetes bacterium]|nr:ribbon-helix-helix protein, CopG family [Planctomycetota bacterium]
MLYWRVKTESHKEVAMVTAHITLTDQESAALGAIAEQVGKSRDELIREAVRQLVTEFRHNHRRELLRQARGM